MIVACYRALPLSACMVYFDLVSILFGTFIPTSFNILVKMFLHLYNCTIETVAVSGKNGTGRERVYVGLYESGGMIVKENLIYKKTLQ